MFPAIFLNPGELVPLMCCNDEGSHLCGICENIKQSSLQRSSLKLFRMVLDNICPDHIDNVFGDIRGVVTDAFKVAGD